MRRSALQWSSRSCFSGHYGAWWMVLPLSALAASDEQQREEWGKSRYASVWNPCLQPRSALGVFEVGVRVRPVPFQLTRLGEWAGESQGARGRRTLSPHLISRPKSCQSSKIERSRGELHSSPSRCDGVKGGRQAYHG